MGQPMKTFRAATTIRSTPERIWALLTDAAAYPSWNSTVENIEGRIARGERITVHAKINPGRAFPVNVSEFNPPKRMVWSGGMPLGLFKGERTFALSPQSNGEIEFSMCEEYTGLLAPLITRSIPNLQPAFDEFAADLKRAAETVCTTNS
jgi:hypothetical protein